MGLLSKLVKKVGKKTKPRGGGILSQIRRRGGFAGAIPMPISGRMGRINRLFGDMKFRDPILAAEQEKADRGIIGRDFADFSIRSSRPRLGFGLGELLPRIKDKVPLAPVFSGMPIPQMVGQPQMLPQPIPRVPVEEKFSEISTPDFAMRDAQMDMMEPRMMMAEGDVAETGRTISDADSDLMKRYAIGDVLRESGITISDQDKNVIINSVLEQTKGRSLSNQDIQMIINMIPRRSGRTISNQDRVMMADGDVALSEEAATDSLDNFLNADPEQVEFGMESRLRNVTLEMMDALSRGDLDAVRELEAEKIMLEKMLRDKKMPKYGPPPRRPEGMAAGGEASFPDLTGDGKVTQADILKGRGVFAEGDEVSMMLMEMDESDDMSEEEMEGLEGLSEVSGPETEMLNNIINQIIELIAQGATEEQIIQFLMEQGLDEEDITEVMSMLSQEMTAGGEEGIDSQLAALG